MYARMNPGAQEPGSTGVWLPSASTPCAILNAQRILTTPIFTVLLAKYLPGHIPESKEKIACQKLTYLYQSCVRTSFQTQARNDRRSILSILMDIIGFIAKEQLRFEYRRVCVALLVACIAQMYALADVLSFF